MPRDSIQMLVFVYIYVENCIKTLITNANYSFSFFTISNWQNVKLLG